mgnify:CR=1 FL=1
MKKTSKKGRPMKEKIKEEPSFKETEKQVPKEKKQKILVTSSNEHLPIHQDQYYHDYVIFNGERYNLNSLDADLLGKFKIIHE